jgi:transposase
MGAPVKKLELSETQRLELEKHYQNGKTHAFRKRCQMMLLKHQGMKSSQVALILGGCEVVINTWMHRYQNQGIQGLQTKPGRGRKSILNAGQDLETIKTIVKENRQRLSVAKSELEEALGKQFSTITLQRYIKKVVASINASENVQGKNHVRSRTNTKSNV